VLHGVPVAPNLVTAPRKTWRRDSILPDHYAALGLRPDADTARIKAAYRLLVKQFHPDVSAANASEEQRIRAINDAYQVLADPAARAEYDQELRHRRAEAGARFWRSFAAGVVAFVLTVGSGVLVASRIVTPPKREMSEQMPPRHPASVLHQSESEARQPKLASAEPAAETPVERATPPAIEEPVRVVPRKVLQPSGPGDIVAQQELAAEEGARASAMLQDHEPVTEPRPAGAGAERVESAAAAGARAMQPEGGAEDPKRPNIALERQLPERPSAVVAEPRARAGDWTAYHNPRFGFALKYPANVFSGRMRDASNRDDLLLSSGRAILWISANANRAGRSVGAYRHSLIAERFAGATFDYAPQRENWFVLSGIIGDEMFYERVTFSCDRQSVHHWLLVYPVAERAFFDTVVEEIHRSYRYDLNQRARCAGRPMGMARRRALPAQGEDDTDSIPY
jgi:hypothetical protein